jgi:uncharacterized Rmd1/YagE family protein
MRSEPSPRRNATPRASAKSGAPQSPNKVADVIAVRVLLLAERLDTRILERDAVLGASPPVTIRLQGDGIAVVFRYGVIVLLDCTPVETERFLARVEPLLTEKLQVAEQEELQLLVGGDMDALVDPAGNIVLHDRSTERLQLVSDVLAKNLMLAHYEARLATIFDTMESLAATLRTRGRAGAPGRELVRHIATALLMQQKMVGRVETGEKPELIWVHPELDRLYVRLAEEYELRERGRAIDRKLEIVSRTIETVLSLERTRSSLRVEWLIAALIIVELLIAVYSLFPKG